MVPQDDTNETTRALIRAIGDLTEAMVELGAQVKANASRPIGGAANPSLPGSGPANPGAPAGPAGKKTAVEKAPAKKAPAKKAATPKAPR